jgi:phosphohistidine phosphatase
MVTLSLLRHAKSAWNNPGASDFVRPLAPRGEKAAPRMGAYMVREGLVPELVLCSTALRARQTLDIVSAEWESKPEIRYEEGLYHAGPAQMLQYLQALTQSCQHAMIIGHNPGMYSLAANLSGDGEADALDALGTNFPTAALAVIKIEREWPLVGPDTGYLQRFVVPRQLPENI